MINLHEPIFDTEDENNVLEALRSSWVSTGGPFIDKFEKSFAEFIGVKHAISVCNGTIGLQLSIEALKIRYQVFKSFDIILPSLTFIATANAVVHSGGSAKFIDVDENSLQFSIENLRKYILSNYEYKADNKFWINRVTFNRLLAFMPVHIMGWSAAESHLLKGISEEFNLTILEDAAEALGTYNLDGSHIGNSSLAAIFSFNGNKILTTGGGGMITTNDSEFAKHLKHLSTTAKNDNLRFVHNEIGYNFRLVNLLAALGCSQLKKLKSRLVRKKEIFNLYSKFLNSSFLTLYKQQNCESNYWLNCVVFDSFNLREKALTTLIENNIQARPLWTPCHLQPAYKTNNNLLLKSTEDMWNRTLSLPSSPQILNEEVKMISDLILLSISGK
ncbi:DegT/DnrJ/EryC1/StrS family aminotransferase [Silvanigrella sp.]|jgi:perosamine synthetase|uniref:DegT/DnrJ/EryC1/StrS family aminotransferase n=1 Tax=Silvanigrella sp. TaxID=2024976 RepID=UPI0037CC7ADC